MQPRSSRFSNPSSRRYSRTSGPAKPRRSRPPRDPYRLETRSILQRSCSKAGAIQGAKITSPHPMSPPIQSPVTATKDPVAKPSPTAAVMLDRVLPRTSGPPDGRNDDERLGYKRPVEAQDDEIRGES